jgi:hypothetical protein
MTMWKNSQRYLEHCLYFDFPVCILLRLKKIGAKTFRFALVHRIHQTNQTYENFNRSHAVERLYYIQIQHPQTSFTLI